MRKNSQNIIGPITFEDYFKEYFTGLRGYIDQKLNDSINHTKKNITEVENRKAENKMSEIVTGKGMSLGINTINNRNSITDFRKKWGVRYKVKLQDTNIEKGIKTVLGDLTNEEYISNYIDKNIARTIKRASLKNINLSTKDISKISQIHKANAKGLYEGKISNKQLTKYNKAVKSLKNNKNIQEIIDFKGQNKAVSFIDDLVKKPFSKAFNISKNVIGSDATQNLAKNFSKSLGFWGQGMNVYTITTDDSNFKVALSGLDLLGDSIGAAIITATGGAGTPIGGLISGITSGLNFAGSTGYDFLFKNTWIGEVLDTGAGYIVNPIRKVVKDIKEGLFTDMTNHQIDFTSPSVRGRTRGIGIPDIKSTAKQQKEIKEKSLDFISPSVRGRTRGIGIKSKPYSNVIDMYHNNSHSIKNNNSKMHYPRGNLGDKLQGGQIDNSNKNNFTININGTNKSTQEIMNEIVPEIKLRMKNISVA
jgi:hypothetical protein